RQADAGGGRHRPRPRLHGRAGPGPAPARQRRGGRPMTAALRARSWGMLAYLLIATLVIGGLGWVTAATLRLELSDQMRLALRRPLPPTTAPGAVERHARACRTARRAQEALPAVRTPGAAAGRRRRAGDPLGSHPATGPADPGEGCAAQSGRAAAIAGPSANE